MRVRAAALAGLAMAWATGSAAAGADGDSTCVRCHLEEEAGLAEGVVEAPGALRVEFAFSAPTREWQESVHAAHQVSCDGCHGGDPHEPDEDLSMSEEAGFLENPSWTEMGSFCGVCHEAVAASYARGVFGQAMDEGVRVATCNTCHMPDGHRILASRPEELLATGRCPSCLPVEDAPELVRDLGKLRALHAALERRLQEAQARGFELADAAGELEELRANVADAVHAFDPVLIRRVGANARERYRAIAATASVAEEELAARRRFGLVLLGALALLFAALLVGERMQRGAS